MSLPILPLDLQLEIFSYLPCKAIVRFMILSHLHHSLLISPDFISRHHSKSRNKFFVLVPSSTPCLCEDDDHLTLFQNLTLPFVHPTFHNKIIGICNGIICMERNHDIFFINPMIRYCFELALHDDEDGSIYSYGSISSRSIYSYGFISRGLSDYLVVKIDSDPKYYYRNDKGELIPPRNVPRNAWVYTYVEDDWRPLEIPNCSLCTTESFGYNGVVYYGLLHWGAKKWVENAWYYFILTFDPQTEVFGELLLADSLVAAHYHPQLCESGVFVGIFVVQNSNKPLTVYSSTLFGINPDIHKHILGFPFLLFHRDDGTLLFGVEFNPAQYLLRLLDISHETVTVLNNIGRTISEDLYIGYSSTSLVLLDEVSASSKYYARHILL
ncbi:hypothetical protein PHAVU_003G040901 [Phaseolus vulgaris]